jgi:beta-galactosidase/beta-glucuronidase
VRELVGRYPFPLDPPLIPAEQNETGTYQRTFTVPDDWLGRRIYIHFSGVSDLLATPAAPGIIPRASCT